MMKRPEFLETKRTPRYSLRKLNVGVASVLLGVTIFGINFTDHSVKAATTETGPSISANSTRQIPAFVLTTQTNTQGETSGQTNTQGETSGQTSGQTNTQGETSASNNTTETQGSTGTNRSAAVTVNPDNINTQPAKENQKLANEHNLSSSDNYSSNIYKGTDGKYYKIVTIYGNDYVYRAADIQASGANLLGRPKQTAEDIKNNINISKEDLGNGKTRWTVVFFPNKGLQNYHGTLHGLSNAKFGIALTSDYQIVGNVDMDVISDPNQSFVSHTFKDNSNRATDIPVQNPSPEVKFSFNPKTDVDENTGLINSKTMPAYNNKYLQGPYYFTTATSAGTNNLWQTYFKDADERKNAYDGTTPYLGGNHDFHVNTFKIANETGVDGAKYADSIIYDKRGGVNGVFNSVNFNQAMEFKSQGYTGNGQSQFSSYVISFTTQHTDSHEVELTPGSKNQQFSGISANIYSFQNGYYSMMSSLYGEQRALDPAGALVEAKKIIPHWGDVKPYMDKIKQDYLNNAQINVLRNKILNNITDPAALNNIVSEGNSLNDAMKKLGNSIGQYDSDGSFAAHKEDTTKASDRYKYANPDKQAAYDNATEVTKALINKDTGTYADKAKVEKLTTDENTAWSALDGVKPTEADKITPNVPKTKEPVANTSSLTDGEKAKVQKNVEDANKDENGKSTLPEGTTVTVGDDGTATINYKDGSKDTIPGSDLVRAETDAEKTTPKVPSTKEPVANTSSLTDGEKAKVQKNVEDANKDENGKSTLPEGTTVTVGDDGTATINYKDGSKDTIPGSDLVRAETDAEKTTPKVPSTKEPVANTSSLTDGEKAKVQKNVEDANKDENGKSTLPEGTTVTVGDDGTATINYKDGSKDTIPGSDLVRAATDADKYKPEGGEITVNRNTKLGPTEAKEAIKNAQSLPEGTTYSWDSKKIPDTSTSGSKDGWVVVTYPDTSHDIVTVKINVKKDAESYTVTPNNEVSVDKGEDVDPASLVTVTDPDGKQVQLPAGSIDWKDGAKPDLTTQGDKTGSVEVTFLDGSKKDTDVTIHVKTDAETYDPQAQPWTTTVGKTPKADEVISSTDKNGKKMPSDAKYTWKTEPNTSKTGEASGEVKVTYSDGSQDEVHVTINVKDKLDDNEKYHIYGKDGLKVDKGQTLDPKDAIDVKDADGNETTLPEKSKVEWTKDKEPDFSQAGKDVTGEVTVTYPDHTQSDSVPVTVHVTGESDKYKVAPKDNVIVPRGSQVDPESTVVAQTPDGKPTSFPDGTKHEWITKPDTDSTGKRTGVVKTTFPEDGSTTTTTVSVTVEPNQSDKYDPKGPKNPDDRVPVKDPEHLTDGDKNKVKDEVVNVNSDLPKGTEVTVDDKGKATIKYPDKSTDTIEGSDLVRAETDAEKTTPKVPSTKEPVANTSSLTDGEKAKVQKNVEDANKDENGKSTLPEGTTVTVGDDGTATINYKDGSKDTIPGSDLVRAETDAEKTTPKVPSTKEPVANTSSLTDGEKAKVQKNVEDANKDENGKSTLPEGTTVTVGDDGTATINYKDGSKDTISGSDLVRAETDAEKTTPKVPSTKEPVANTSSLTDGEKAKVQKNVEDANKDENGKSTLPEGTTVTVGDDGTATINYKDGSKDTIPGSDLVRAETDAEKTTPKVPSTKEPVANTSSLTDGEKAKVQKNVEDANKDENGKSTLPEGTTVTVGDDGTATINYKDGSKDTISGSDLVRAETDAEKTTPKVPSTKEPVANTSSLTDGEKAKVQKNVEDANKDENGKSTLPEGTTVTVGDDGTATINYKDGSKDTISGSDLVRAETDAEKTTPKVPSTKEPVANTSSLTDGEKAKVQKNVEDANKDENGKSTLPEGTTVTVGDDGTATINYKDGSKDTISGSDLVRAETDAEKTTPKVPSTKEPVANTSSLTDGEKAKVQKNVEDANKDENGKSTLPEGTTVTVGDDGTATINYKDGSKDTISGSDLVRAETDAEKTTPKVPSTKEPVANTSSLTDGEKAKVQKNVEDANKDENGKSTLPEGTTVTVGDDGTATINYKDGSKDTIPGDQLVQGQKGDTTDAGKITPTVPGDKVTVKDPSHLTDDEKNQVKNNVDNANKDKFPAGTEVTVGDDGTATVTYPDGSKDTIPGDQLVQGQKGDTTDAGKITPTVSGDKVTVKDPSHLTDDEKNQVKNNVDNANKDKFPAGTEVTVGDDGTATVTYPDGSKDTIPGDQLVQGQKGDTTDAGKITPTVPGDKVTVKDPSHLTDDEKNQVKNNVDNANKDKFPAGTEVTVGDDGTATVTYPDGSKDTIPGDQLVQGQKGDTTDAGKITPTVSGDKVTVKDPSHLTDDEKNQVKNNVDNANKDKFPAGTEVTVGDDGTATVNYPDGSKDTIPGDQLVQGQKGDTTDAGKITPTVPGDKVTVKDPSHLTDDEKNQVKNNVDNANKDKFPEGTKVTVGDDGTATVNYPDGSKDTIPGDQLVQGQKGDTTDAGKITPTVPGDKVTVKDPSHLTDDEKNQVKNNVDNANKDKFPEGTKVTVGDDGTATVNYPDGSKDTIPGDQLVQGQKGDTTDAGKITPTVPGDKVTVKDPSHLTDDEKNQVKNNVDNANKDKFPEGTKVTVGNDGTTTITYPDGSKDTIPGSDLVRQSTDADKTTPSVPGTKVPVTDPSHLTDTEKDQVKTNVTNANKDTLPSGSQVTVGNDGTTTITYPDGSKDTIPGSDLVRQSTDADKITPKVPATKVPVTNPSQLTDSEKDQVKTNVTNANKDTLPSGSQVTVGNDGTTTTTYPDGSKDTIPGSDLVRQSTDADKTTPSVPATKVPVTDPSHLTDDEKDQVKTNVTNANKDNLPSGSQVTVGNDGTTTTTYPDGSKDTIPGSDLVRQSTDADKITPKVPETKVPVTNPSQLTDSEKDQVKTNVTNANKDTLPSGSQVTVGNDGTTTTTYPDGSKDTIPGSDLVRQSTDADKTTPSVPATKVPVTDPSQLTDSEKDQVKTNVTNANKDTLPSGSQITVGDDGTATITYPDGSKDTIPGRDLIKGISGNKHDSNSSSGSNGTISNTDDETSGDTVNNAESMNGNTAKSGSKNNSLKTLPQTGTKDVTILEILGLFLSLFGLLGLKKKHHEE